MGDALRLTAGRGHPAVVMRFELANAGGVIGVVMGDENIGEPPAGFLKRRLDRPGFRGID